MRSLCHTTFVVETLPMKFEVTEIEFDFEQNGEYPDKEYQEKTIQESLGIWEVENEDFLTDVISDKTGWCVSYIEYCEA